MLLHLVRHGQSTWNLEGRLQGQSHDVPLTTLGESQALEAATCLASRPVAAVWSSDQVRAVETARPIAARHGLELIPTPLLREQALGDLEGRLSSELVAQPTPEGQHVSEVAWGGGESLLEVYQRLQQFLSQIFRSQQPADEVVLVSHGDTLRVLLALLQGRSHRDIEWITIANGAVLSQSWPPKRYTPLPAQGPGRGTESRSVGRC